jgi:hypothetical protein
MKYRRTKGDQARDIAEAVIKFLKWNGYLTLGEMPEEIREELEEAILRVA